LALSEEEVLTKGNSYIVYTAGLQLRVQESGA
jgi:hypothetical protein